MELSKFRSFLTGIVLHVWNWVLLLLLLMTMMMMMMMIIIIITNVWPVPVAAGTKTGVCGCSLDGIAGSNPVEGSDVCLL